MDYDSRTKSIGLTERKGWSIIEKHGGRLYRCYKEQKPAKNRKSNNKIETKALALTPMLEVNRRIRGVVSQAGWRGARGDCVASLAKPAAPLRARDEDSDYSFYLRLRAGENR
jgi:hypothetical protein